jgi:hypothetical protein
LGGGKTREFRCVVWLSGIQTSLTYSFVSLISFVEDGKYRFCSGKELPVAHVWFSHSLLGGRSSTYIITDCPEKSKEIILSYAQEANIQTLLRPLAIDAFLSEECLHEWGQEIFVPRKELVEFVGQGSTDRKLAENFLTTPERKPPQFQNSIQLKPRRLLNVFILFLGVCI